MDANPGRIQRHAVSYRHCDTHDTACTILNSHGYRKRHADYDSDAFSNHYAITDTARDRFLHGQSDPDAFVDRHLDGIAHDNR